MSHDRNGQPADIDMVLEKFSRMPLPADVEARLRRRAEQFQAEIEVTPDSSAMRRRIPRRWALVATSLAVAAAVIAIVSLGIRDAWAQVAQSLAAKPWIRLTLQIPAGAAPEGPPKAFRKPPQIWLSPVHKAAAMRFLDSVQYLDFARDERFRYAPDEKIVYWESASDGDQAEFEYLNTLLRLIGEGGGKLTLPQSAIEIVGRSQNEAPEGDRIWLEFTFKCRDLRRSAAEFMTTLRVDPESKLPVEMRTTGKFASNDREIERTFRFDYPDRGPSDVFDLGVARTAKILDRRLPSGAEEVFAAHAKAQQDRGEPYSALVLMSDVESDFADVFNAMRVRYDGQTWQMAQVDMDQLMTLRQQVWSKQMMIPQDADPATWWKEHVARLSFENTTQIGNPSGNSMIPDRVGYYLFGDPTAPGAEVSVDRRPAIGPANTVLVSIRTTAAVNRYWMAPEHGYAAVRFECPSGDTTFGLRTIIIDRFEQSPGGHWYATQVRVGDVEHSGDQPRSDRGVAPIATSVFRHFVEFEK